MSRKIGWQKYEDVIQSEMYSPIANMIFDEIATDVEPEEYEEEEMENQETLFVPKNFYETISLKNKLNEVDGIEVLNIVSRYRFFIGIGKMFKFSDVRKDIEKSIISKGETLGNAIEESS